METDGTVPVLSVMSMKLLQYEGVSPWEWSTAHLRCLLVLWMLCWLQLAAESLAVHDSEGQGAAI